MTGMFVCLSVGSWHISKESHVRTSNFLCVLPLAVARSSSGGVAIKKRIAVCASATGTHVPYGITQCYLPSGRGDIPAFTPAN